MYIDVVHDPMYQRFQALVDGSFCVADYRLENGVMIITHTEVPPQLEGRGIAAALIAAMLEHARTHGLKVDPACSYARAYMNRHAETLALLA